MSTRNSAILALAFALPFSFAMPMGGQMALAEGPAVKLTVTGDGVSAASPDMATLTIGVTANGETAAAALTANSAALAPVLKRLHEAGIADRDLQTTNLSVNPDYNTSNKASGYGDSPGYTAQNFVTVTIRDLDQLGPILDAAMADGANTMNGLTFGLSQPRPALDAARGAAVEDARAKADVLAGAVGQSVGRLLSITEGADFSGGAPMYRDAKAMSVPVEVGEVSYSASVTMVWELTD